MKRLQRNVIHFVAGVLLSSGAIAAEPAEHRYLVGIEPSTDAAAANISISEDGRARPVHRFRHVDAYSTVLTEAEAAELARKPGIRYVERDRILTASELSSLSDGRSIRERGDWSRALGSATTQAMPYGIGFTRAPSVWHVTRGAGVKVAVIDTGIDTGHPDLVDRYKGGFDFVNNDSDPMDDNGHGTHVAGTIGASYNDFGVVGVAPEVELYGLKVLGADGNGSSTSLIAAVDWAIDHGIDVINMSLGSSASLTTERLMFERASEAGIISVAASGNNYQGTNLVDFPAAYADVIAVGAVDSNRQIGGFSQRGLELELVGAGVGVTSTYFLDDAYRIGPDSFVGFPMTFSATEPLVTAELIPAGIGQPGDFPATTAGRIVLIERGTLTFREKSDNAKAAGAVAAIIYNNEPGTFLGTLCGDPCVSPPINPIPTVSVSQEDGQTLLDLGGEEIEMSLGAVSAYGDLQGTSMATPHVAGVVALLRGLDPDATPAEIRNVLSLTAEDLGNPGRDTVYGFGLADAYSAARMLDPGSFSSQGRKRGVGRPD